MTFEVLNRYETSLVNTAAQAVAYVGLSGSEHLRIHLDTFHMAVEEADISEAIRIAMPALGYLELGQSGRGPLSTGALDIPEIVRSALDDGYDGQVGCRGLLALGAADARRRHAGDLARAVRRWSRAGRRRDARHPPRMVAEHRREARAAPVARRARLTA